jgi:hypothetical protein
MAETKHGEAIRQRAGVLRRPSVGQLVLVATACLAAQVLLTDYGDGGVRAAVFWLVIGCWMLWLVYRRQSRAARILLISTSLIGAVVYAVGAVTDPRDALLVLLFLGEGAPLLFPQVADHVRPVEPPDPPAEPQPAD